MCPAKAVACSRSRCAKPSSGWPGLHRGDPERLMATIPALAHLMVQFCVTPAREVLQDQHPHGDSLGVLARPRRADYSVPTGAQARAQFCSTNTSSSMLRTHRPFFFVVVESRPFRLFWWCKRPWTRVDSQKSWSSTAFRRYNPAYWRKVMRHDTERKHSKRSFTLLLMVLPLLMMRHDRGQYCQRQRA